jgi:hypothetical protein
MAQDWNEEFARMLAEVQRQLGNQARAVVSVFGRLDQDKTPEDAERIKQQVVSQVRSSHRGRGRARVRLEQGRVAEDEGIEAAMKRFNITMRTAVDCRGEYRASRRNKE